MDWKEISALISNSEKQTPAVVFIRGNFSEDIFKDWDIKFFGNGNFWILVGDWKILKKIRKEYGRRIKDIYVDIKAAYSAMPLKDLRNIQARIEPGAIIRKGAKIGKDTIIMMGAVINIGAVIGARTMVDMNAVIGARAIIGKDCHIGAGAVISGVLEPPSAKPVRISDRVLIGANAVVLEGVKVGKNAIVGAGSVVLTDVKENIVVAGAPAREIKKVKDVDKMKRSILKELRGVRH